MLLLHGETGPVPEDRAIGDYLRTLDLPVVPVVNKGDHVEVGDVIPRFLRGLAPGDQLEVHRL